MLGEQFTHLQVASGFSFKFGTALPEQLVQRAATLGMQSLALTDYDNMAGAIRFSKACEAYGIRPILGVNVSFIQKRYRVTLLAQQGKLPSLYRLLSAINMANKENVLTLDVLKQFECYAKDVLILHGPQSAIAEAITNHRSQQALSMLQGTNDLFARQAIACVSHLERRESQYSTATAARLLHFAHTHAIDAVLTNAVRLLHPQDAPLADVLDASRNHVLLSDKTSQRQNAESYLKSAADMIALAQEIALAAGDRDASDLLRTTRTWSEQTELSVRQDVGIGAIHLPEPSVFGLQNHAQLTHELQHRCQSQLHAKYQSDLIAMATTRLEEELATIAQLAFESYFLTVGDIAQHARSQGIRVSARGSGAGSIVCYLLGISNVEPLRNGLLMERFCSALRTSLPDIDIDVESARRLEIYDHIISSYGDSNWHTPGNQSRCATVAMTTTYRAKSAVRDVGEALGVTDAAIDALAKNLPHIKSKNISRALETIPELRQLHCKTTVMQTVIALAQRLDGLPRHLAMHPCAIVLSDCRLHDVAPVMTNNGGYPMLNFDKDDVEDLGLLKLDVLGVRMQSAIAYTLDEIHRIEQQPVDIDAIPLDDKATFDVMKSTRTLGLFQVESPGQRELLGKLAPNSFNDLVIGISLFRPGPVKSDMITPFLNTRQGFTSRPVLHPDLTEILDETEGVVVFHEQVIKILSTITGVSYAQADEKRRELGTRDGQQQVCDWFYARGIARGYPQTDIDQIWNVLRDFASFGFCKAHAVAFALPTYQSGWLKTHHTAAFLAGVLTHDPGMYPQRLIVDEARQWGIHIAPVDVNLSDATYRVEKSSLSDREPYQAPDTQSTGETLVLPDARGYAIRLPLTQVHGITQHEIDSIISNRPYSDLTDFFYRAQASMPTIEALLDIGAFDELSDNDTNGLNRRDLYLHLLALQKHTNGQQRINRHQMNLVVADSHIEHHGLPEITLAEQIHNELAVLGTEVTSHVLVPYGDFLNAIGVKKSSQLIRERSGTSVLVVGVKVALQTPPTRTGKRVMFLTLDDGFGCNDLTFFADAQEQYAHLIRHSNLILAQGVIRRTGPRGLSLRATKAWDLQDAFTSWLQQQRTS